jgi:carotenoid cleavage dioxygenase-like enzyme
MVHSIRIKDGSLKYCNKYTLTDKLISEMQYGKPIMIRVGEMTSGINGLIKTGVREIQTKIWGYVPTLEKYKEGHANTSFITHSGRTFALAEQFLPFRIDMSQDEFDLKSAGYEDFEG